MDKDNFTNKIFYLDVGEGHKLWIHDWGNKHAKTPILFLHGGPGAGVNNGHQGYFNPEKQRVIFYDQRGSGKSKPAGSLRSNTTEHCIDDINKITGKLGIKKFIITGGSWGSCLALAYALKHPSKVKALVLRGIFTGSKREIDYLDKGEFRAFFPDVWDDYLQRTPAEHHDDPTAYHQKMYKSKDKAAAKASAYAYSELESALLGLDDRFHSEDYDSFDPAAISIELHYLSNGCFMPDRLILDNAHKIPVPTWLIQGRYDAVCPPITAYEMHKALPSSHLIWTIAGHKGSDRGIHDVSKAILEQLTS